MHTPDAESLGSRIGLFETGLVVELGLGLSGSTIIVLLDERVTLGLIVRSYHVQLISNHPSSFVTTSPSLELDD